MCLAPTILSCAVSSVGPPGDPVLRPLAGGDEPYVWVNETRIPPWAILRVAAGAGGSRHLTADPPPANTAPALP